MPRSNNKSVGKNKPKSRSVKKNKSHGKNKPKVSTKKNKSSTKNKNKSSTRNKNKSSSKKKRPLNEYFKLMLEAKKAGKESFEYKGQTYVGKKHDKLGMVYKKGAKSN